MCRSGRHPRIFKLLLLIASLHLAVGQAQTLRDNLTLRAMFDADQSARQHGVRKCTRCLPMAN
ncbi:hypothetical protein A0U90_02725 [Kozakia baliensis]|nr:hypothetical protein A0U90_02725 [Kozakia baliensis]